MAINHVARLTTAFALLAGAQTAAFAAGSDQEREACTPDAFRLCASSMPDEGRVESCLRAAGPRLSGPCHAVFYPPAAANAQMARQRAAPSAPQRSQTPSMPQTQPAPAEGDE
jgi:hypothetical protein